VNTFLAHAERGPLKNETRSRALGGGIFELKTRQGDRLLYFYYGLRTTVLANGFKKGARLRDEVRRAERLRAQLEEEGASI
jgi:putative component of toxin-antitoxin plasmid stabilization module